MNLAVIGNIGAGKSTLCKMLAKHYNLDILKESVEDNPFLELFYEEPKKWCFKLQLHMFIEKANQQRKMQNSILDRVLQENYYVFTRNAFEAGFIDKLEYDLLTQNFSLVSNGLEEPDLVIYLKRDASELKMNIDKRGREMESGVSLQYLEDLNKLYNTVMKSAFSHKMIVVDDCFDFENNNEDFIKITEKINKYGK